MTNELDLNELAQAKYDAWELPQLTYDEQVEWFQKNTIEVIARTGLGGDRVEEIRVPGALYEALSDAIDNPRLPDLPFGDLDTEEAQKVLNDWCKDIIIRSSLVEQMAVPKEYHEQLPPEIQFIQIITAMRRQQAILDSWDQALGISAIANQEMPGIMPFTFNEKRLAFLFYCTMNGIARFEMARQQQMAQQQAQQNYSAPNFDLPK